MGFKGKRNRKIVSKGERFRLSIFRSNKNIYAQIINDDNGTTLVSTNSVKLGLKNNIATAGIVGKNLAKIASEKGITTLVVDRGHYKYHGRIKALVESLRQSGLIL